MEASRWGRKRPQTPFGCAEASPPRLLASAIAGAMMLAARPGLTQGDAGPPDAPPEASDAPPSGRPLEVTVRAPKAPPGAVVLDRREIRDMPGVMGDPYRAIEAQPGVTPAASGIPYYFVRGAPPGNVGYFLDGISVPFLFHIGAGPGVIPPSLVKNVELYLGSYPASLGRLAGAVVAAETLEPRSEWHGDGIFRTLDLGGLVEGPLGDDVTVLAGGHYALGAPLLHALVPQVDLGYADYQARASVKHGARGRLTVFAFGSYDYLARFEDDQRDVLLDSDFHRLDVRYDRDLGDGATARAGVTLGLDQSRGAGIDRARDLKLGARARVVKPLGERVVARGGVDIAVDVYDIDPGGDPCPNGACPPGIETATERELEAAFRVLFPSRNDVATGVWGELQLDLGGGSTLTPGARVDHYVSAGETAVGVDPRLAGRFAVSRTVWLVPAVGIASQLPSFAPIPALQIGGIPGGLQRSLQASFGAEAFVLPFDLRTTVFRQVTFGLTDAIGSDRGAGFSSSRFLSRSTGDAYGLEVAVKGALRRDLFLLTAYTLSRATRTRGGITRPSAYDRTHVAHVALLYDLGRGWRGGIRHVFYTGFPADEIGPGHVPSESPPRTRPFYRLDLRLSKRWNVGRNGYVGLVFDMQNVTLAPEVFDVQCDEQGCEPRTIGPIAIPGLALEGGF